MKKFKEYLMISIFALVILLLNKNSAMSNEKTSAIVGHVITQAIQGNDMNHTEVFTNELNALMHKFSLDMLDIFLEHMPNVLDSVQKELKLEADKRYKCSLQDDDYKNKECI